MNQHNQRRQLSALLLAVFLIGVALPLSAVQAAEFTDAGLQLQRLSASASYTASSSSPVTVFLKPATSITAGANKVKVDFEAETSGFAVNATASNLTIATGTGSWSTSSTANNAIATTASTVDTQPQSVSDGAGGAIIAFQTGAGSATNIYAQRINASGVVQWTANGVVVSSAINDQSNPVIASDGAGGAIIVWQDFRTGGTTGYDIYAQRINASGVVQWTANGVVVSSDSSYQEYPRIIADGADGVISTWKDARGGASTNGDIYAQRINASGVVQWTANGVQISTSSTGEEKPNLVSDTSAGAIITWEDEKVGTGEDIYAQRIDSSGTVQWTAGGVVISNSNGAQEISQIVADGSGGAVIGFQNAFNIYAQRINASGAVQWTVNGVSVSSATGNQHTLKMISDGSAGALIVWIDERTGATSDDIYAQRIDSSGTVQWTANGVAVSAATGAQSTPEISSDGNTGAIITWQDPRNDAGDIYAQRIIASGTVQWTADGVAVSVATNTQSLPAILADGSGNVIIAWKDTRSDTNGDIYAQKVSADGALGGSGPALPSIGGTASTAVSGVSTATATTGNGSADSGGLVTFPFTGAMTAGTLYAFHIVGGVTTPVTAGEFTVSFTTVNASDSTVDQSETAVAIIAGSDQIAVSGSVDANFEYTLDTTAMAFGTLSDATISSTSGNNVTIATNAEGGWTVMVKSANKGLTSSAESNTIAATGSVDASPSTISANTQDYGLDVNVTTNGSNGTGGAPTAGAEYNASTTQVGSLNTDAFQEAGYGDGTTDGDAITLILRAAIGDWTKEATDYADTLTVVGAGSF